MQKISQIHQFILEIEQILEFRDLKDNAHFLLPASKNC